MAKRNQKKSIDSCNPSAPVTNCPAVSVVIPLYNAEKYIGECLDSILAQTFQNFEVIVVDDCSTDSSCSIVESYREKFGGRLTLSHMDKNTGGCALPRNKGMILSRGEYIAFIDPDDTITLTALEELYTLAKKFDADVLHCEKCYRIPEEHWDDHEYRKNLQPWSYQNGDFVDNPLIVTNDLSERVKLLNQKRFIFNAFLKFFRRDFILDNEIEFADIFAEDLLFTICAVCSAQKYVIVPNIFYYYRIREGSIMSSQRDPSQRLHRQIKALKNGFRYLDKFLNNMNFFHDNPDLKYSVFNFFAQDMLKYLNEIYAQIPAYSLNELLLKEFSDGDNTTLMAFIFSTMNIQRLQLMQAQRQFVKFQQFAAQAKARIAQLEAELKRLKSQPQ